MTQALTTGTAIDLCRTFKALGNPVRLRLLSLIASHHGAEVCVCDLMNQFDVSNPTISHHLKVLRNAGLIDCQRRGTWVFPRGWGSYRRYWRRRKVLRRASRRISHGNSTE